MWKLTFIVISAAIAAGATGTGLGAQQPLNPPLHIAVGVPREDVGSIRDAGVVQLLLSAPIESIFSSNLDRFVPNPASTVTFRQGREGIAGKPETGDRFGFAVVFGDFNGDEVPDIAISAPFEDIRGRRDAGLVSVVHGSGLTSTGGRTITLHQGKKGVAGKLEAGDRFGYSLAVADMNGDGFDDLAVGVPYEDHSGVRNAGEVQLFLGSRKGLTTESITYRQGSDGLGDQPERNDKFGFRLAGIPGRDVLAVGIPFEDIEGVRNAGAVQTISARRPEAQQFFHQGMEGFGETLESGDRFGDAVSVWPSFGNPQVDLLIGVPREDIGGLRDAGQVHQVTMPDPDRPELGARFLKFNRNTRYSPGSARQGDRFGQAVEIRVNQYWAAAPREDAGSTRDAGSIYDLNGPRRTRQASPGVPGSNDANDQMGRSLTSSRRLLTTVVGLPGEDAGGANSSGAILIHQSDGVNVNQWLRFDQTMAAIPSAAEVGDRFGSVVAAW